MARFDLNVGTHRKPKGKKERGKFSKASSFVQLSPGILAENFVDLAAKLGLPFETRDRAEIFRTRN